MNTTHTIELTTDELEAVRELLDDNDHLDCGQHLGPELNRVRIKIATIREEPMDPVVLAAATIENRIVRALLLNAKDTLRCMSLSEAFPYLGKIDANGDLNWDEEDQLVDALNNLIAKPEKIQ